MPVISVSLSNSLYEWLENSRGEKKRSAYIADLLQADMVQKEAANMEWQRQRPKKGGRQLDGKHRIDAVRELLKTKPSLKFTVKHRASRGGKR